MGTAEETNRAWTLFDCQALVANWQTAGLIKPSVFKPLVTTIEQSLVIKRLGRLSTNDTALLRAGIEKIVG